MKTPISSPHMHVSLNVENIAKTTAFYDRFFGQSPAKVREGYAKYELDSPGLVISFVQGKEGINPEFGHLGFRVASQEDLNLQLALAKKHGFVQLEEKGTACCYAIQDKFWTVDPDGYRWEVYYFHGDTEQNDPEYNLTEEEGCCAPEQKEASLTGLSQEKVCC